MTNNKLRNDGTTLLETLVGLLIVSLLVVLVVRQQLLHFQVQIEEQHRLQAHLAAIDFAERASLAQEHRRRTTPPQSPPNFVCTADACSARLQDPAEWSAWAKGLKKNLPHPSWAVQTTGKFSPAEFGSLQIQWSRQALQESWGNRCTSRAHTCLSLSLAW